MHLCFHLTIHCVCIMVMFMFFICSQKQSIEMRRETVIRSLILYLGEKEEELLEDLVLLRPLPPLGGVVLPVCIFFWLL